MLDAYWWKGDKLQVTNHSPDPSCYPKVIMAVVESQSWYIYQRKYLCRRGSLLWLSFWARYSTRLGKLWLSLSSISKKEFYCSFKCLAFLLTHSFTNKLLSTLTTWLTSWSILFKDFDCCYEQTMWFKLWQMDWRQDNDSYLYPTWWFEEVWI